MALVSYFCLTRSSAETFKLTHYPTKARIDQLLTIPAPALICIDDAEVSALPQGAPDYAELLNEARVKQYREIIDMELRFVRLEKKGISGAITPLKAVL